MNSIINSIILPVLLCSVLSCNSQVKGGYLYRYKVTRPVFIEKSNTQNTLNVEGLYPKKILIYADFYSKDSLQYIDTYYPIDSNKFMGISITGEEKFVLDPQKNMAYIELDKGQGIYYLRKPILAKQRALYTGVHKIIGGMDCEQAIVLEDSLEIYSSTDFPAWLTLGLNVPGLKGGIVEARFPKGVVATYHSKIKPMGTKRPDFDSNAVVDEDLYGATAEDYNILNPSPSTGKARPRNKIVPNEKFPFEADTDLHALFTNNHDSLTLINFWFSSCLPCREEVPLLKELKQYFVGRPIRFLSMTYESQAASQKFLETTEFNFRHYFEKTTFLFKVLQLEGYPKTVLLDKSGVVIAFKEGQLNLKGKEDLQIKIQNKLIE